MTFSNCVGVVFSNVFTWQPSEKDHSFCFKQHYIFSSQVCQEDLLEVQSIFAKSVNVILVPWLGLSLVFSNFSLSLGIFKLTVDVGVTFITADY